MDDQARTTRQAALLVVVFVATLALLAGGWAILAGARGSGPSASGSPPGSTVGGLGRLPPTPEASGSASAQPTSTSPEGSPSGVPGASGEPGQSGEPSSSGEPATIVLSGAGDIASCGSNGAKLTSDLLLAQQGSFFTAGDNAYEDGSRANFADCYAPTWGRLLDRTILPAPGNHDWQTSGAAGYRAYFGTRAAPQGVTWYSTDLGAWHVVVLDSDCDQVGGCDAASPEGRWLANDLATSTARCTLAIWHHPRFSSGEHGDDPQVGTFWELLHRDGAELVINGHDHDYERFAPQDPTGHEERPNGIREIVVGTGGAVLRQFHAIAPNSELRIAGSYGVLRLTLHAANYDWEYLPATGAVADAGSALCH